MMCKKPYMRTPTGVTRKQTTIVDGGRLAATPFGCGQCLHCRINKSRVWAHRILLESYMHDNSSFLTLTYNDDHLPTNGDLNPSDLKQFIKSLRNCYPPKTIRYFAVGEYGDITWRPHYHLALFGHCLMDIQPIEKSWTKGFYQLGDLNEKSAQYLCGYITKNLARSPNSKNIAPEFQRASNRPGIGRDAMKVIAKQIKRNKYWEKRTIRELSYGQKKKPLGRYLITKLNEDLGVGKDVTCLEVYDYQEEIFKNIEKKGVYYENLQDEKKGERIAQAKRAKIHKQKRKL